MNKKIVGILAVVLGFAASLFFFTDVFRKSKDGEEKPVSEIVQEKKVEDVAQAPHEENKQEVSTEVKPQAPVATPEKVETPAPAEVKESTEGKKIAAELPDGSKITVDQIQENMVNLPPQLKNLPFEKVYEVLQRRFIDMWLVLDAAKKAGTDKDPELLKRIDEGMEALLQKAYLDKEIAKLITDAILQDKYQELLKMLPKDEMEVKVCHILVKTKEDADAVMKDLKAGKKFEELVVEKSLDKQTAAKGGDIGYLRRGDLPKESSDTVFKTAKGALVSEPIAVGDMGFSVMRVDDKRAVEPPKFEEVKADIQKAVAPEYAVKVIEALRKSADVKKIGLDGKPLVEKTGEEKAKDAEAANKKPDEKKDETPAVDVSKLDDKMVVATFASGETITLADVKASVGSLPPQLKEMPLDKIYDALLNRIVDMKLISAAARKDGLDKDKDVLKRQQQARDALTQKAYLDKQVAERVTPDMLKDKYQELIKMMPKDEMEVRLRHILLKTKKEAEDVMRRLKAGEKFDDIVKSASVDEQTRNNGGELGYVRRPDLPKEFGDAVFKAAKATLLAEPIHLGDLGYSVVRVEDKRPIELPKLDEVKGEIVKILSSEIALKVVNELRAQFFGKIKRFDLAGQLMAEKAPEMPKTPDLAKTN